MAQENTTTIGGGEQPMAEIVSPQPADQSVSPVKYDNHRFGLLKIREEVFLQAIEESDGTKTDVARKLGIHRNTVRMYIERNPKLAEAFDQVVESRLDLAESKLLQLVRAGDLGAIIFFLKCQGKRRGYIEKQVVEGSIDIRSEKRELRIVEFRGLESAERASVALASLKAHLSLDGTNNGVKLLSDGK